MNESSFSPHGRSFEASHRTAEWTWTAEDVGGRRPTNNGGATSFNEHWNCSRLGAQRHGGSSSFQTQDVRGFEVDGWTLVGTTTVSRTGGNVWTLMGGSNGTLVPRGQPTDWRLQKFSVQQFCSPYLYSQYLYSLKRILNFV